MASVTITGWLLFFWTALFLYIILGGIVNHIRYVGIVLKLSKGRARYQPLHHDNSGGMRYLAQPAMEFLRVMIVLLALFGVFYLYDRIVYEVEASIRLNALVIYLLVTPPLFLTPILSLHLVMSKSRDHLLEGISQKMTALVENLANLDAVRGASEMEALSKICQQIRSFPVWPLPFKQIVESGSYLIGPAIAYSPTLLSLFRLGSQ